MKLKSTAERKDSLELKIQHWKENSLNEEKCSYEILKIPS
jgi:hypothetical protein